jgi:hypothetical protein
MLGLTIALATFYSKVTVGQSNYFNNTYSYSPYDYSIALGVLALENGNFISTEQFSPFSYRYGTVVKEYNSEGNIIDTAVFLDPGYNVSPSWPASPIEVDGKVYFAAYRRIDPATTHGVLFSYEGNRLSELATCTFQDSVSSAIIQMKYKEGKLYMAGRSFKYLGLPSFNEYRHQVYISQFDTSGTKQWDNYYAAQNGYWAVWGYSIDATDDGGFIVGGKAIYDPVVNDQVFSGAFVLLTDSLGNKIADRYFPNDSLGNDEAHVLQLDNGNYLVAYTHALEAKYGGFNWSIQSWARTRELVITELDQHTLETVWEKRNLNDAWLNSISISELRRQSDSTFLIFGDRPKRYGEWDPGPSPGWIYAFNQSGDSLWYREYAHKPGINEGHLVMGGSLTPDGGILMGGYSGTDTASLEYHTWLIKLDSIGCPFEGCDTVYYEKILDYNLYPNPTSGELTLEMPDVERAELMLYDLAGRELLNKRVRLDHGAVRFDLVEQGILPEGIYILKIDALDGRQTFEKVYVVN